MCNPLAVVGGLIASSVVSAGATLYESNRMDKARKQQERLAEKEAADAARTEVGERRDQAEAVARTRGRQNKPAQPLPLTDRSFFAAS